MGKTAKVSEIKKGVPVPISSRTDLGDNLLKIKPGEVFYTQDVNRSTIYAQGRYYGKRLAVRGIRKGEHAGQFGVWCLANKEKKPS
jgi:hypothetical protein